MKVRVSVLCMLAAVLLLSSCKKNVGIDPTDSIVGRYTGTVHYNNSSYYASIGTRYLDTTFTVTYVITKVESGVFCPNYLFEDYPSASSSSIVNSPLIYGDTIHFNSSNYYNLHWRPRDEINLQFFPESDSIYLSSSFFDLEGGGSVFWVQNEKTFSGKK